MTESWQVCNSRERLNAENITERCRKARLKCFGKTQTMSEEILMRWYHLGEEDRSRGGWTVSTETSERQKMKSMTELSGGELSATANQ